LEIDLSFPPDQKVSALRELIGADFAAEVLSAVFIDLLAMQPIAVVRASGRRNGRGDHDVNALTLQESTGQAEFVATAPVSLMEHGTAIRAEYPAYSRTAFDELLNTVTHGCGLMLALVGTYLMLGRLNGSQNPWLVAGCGMYLISLLGVYSMSTLSHGATSVRWKTTFRQLDQGFIYLLIVGTYTPFSIAYLHEPLWLALLCGMWSIAFVAFISKVFFGHRVDSVSVMSCIMFGWIPVVAIPTLMHESPAGAFNMIIGGGVCYTIGTIFLINDERVKNFHALWHLCVIGGSVCHFWGILNYVLAG
jgi:hemolysin III